MNPNTSALSALRVANSHLSDGVNVGLLREANYLRAGVFWMSYGTSQLDEAIKKFNAATVNCGCEQCKHASWFKSNYEWYEHSNEDARECQLCPLLLEVAGKYRLQVGTCTAADNVLDENPLFDRYNVRCRNSGDNALCTLDSDRGHWRCVRLGQSLWQCVNLNAGLLAQYRSFVNHLEEGRLLQHWSDLCEHREMYENRGMLAPDSYSYRLPNAYERLVLRLNRI